MKKPNFFIIGAPKCGTTSLAAWLSEHPQVYFSPKKEPHFFNFDFSDRQYRSLKKYESLFSGATSDHIAIGEAPVRYLYSRTAVPAILAYNEDARFIVMVRDPVDMAYALHEQTVFNGDEDEESFEHAWELQAVRKYGDHVPPRVDPQTLLYGDLCRLGAQIARLFEAVPRERVLIVNLENVKHDPRHEYLRVLDFLGLDDDRRYEFPVLNTAKVRRSIILWRAVKRANRTLQAMGIWHIRLGLTAFIKRENRQARPRPPMNNKVRAQLHAYFSDDVRLLKELTDNYTADPEGRYT